MQFQHVQGDLDMRLYNSAGTQIRISDSDTNEERVSLVGLAAGTYSLQVYGYQGVHNPNYTLDLNPGAGASGGGNKVAYVVFDGATITRADLLRWSADWSADARVWRDEDLDAEGDGIHVQPYLAGRADREQIISRILVLMQEDLQPFGVTVRRQTGPVVEGVGATTHFVGSADLSGTGFAGIACDIDFDNNNRTDISFALEQFPGTTVEETAMEMADLNLHELGHTFGLYHVDAPFTNEVMGMGYSFGTYAGENATYRDDTYPEYLDHGYGRGPQNSYRALRNVFTTGTGGLGVVDSDHTEEHGLHFDTNHGAVYFGHQHHEEVGVPGHVEDDGVGPAAPASKGPGALVRDLMAWLVHNRFGNARHENWALDMITPERCNELSTSPWTEPLAAGSYRLPVPSPIRSLGQSCAHSLGGESVGQPDLGNLTDLGWEDNTEHSW
jgi:hypothetical protein